MTYVENLVDNFNDNSFNTSIWTTPAGSSYITETAQQLHIAANTGYESADTIATYDITAQIFAVYWRTGTNAATASTTFNFVAIDGSGNGVVVNQTPISHYWGFQTNGSATVSGAVGTGSGLGTDLPDGIWIGMGNLGADNIFHVYTSTDGLTWTELGSCTVGGTFNKTAVSMRIQLGYYTSSENSTWILNLDEAAVFNQYTAQPSYVRVGGAWVSYTPQVRVAGAWVTPTVKVRSGGAWVAF